MRTLLTLLFLATAAGCASTPDLHPAAPQHAQTDESRRSLSDAGLVRKTLGTMVYWTGGNSRRPPLVLVHGINEHAGTWAAAAPLLAPDYRLIIPDLAGHGESEPKTGPITYAAMVEGIASLIDHEVQAGKVTLAGNSMGGWLSMLYAFDHADRVERLVLEDASGMAWFLGDVPLIPKTREEAARVLRAVHGPNADTSDAAVDALLARKNPQMARVAIADALANLVDRRLPELKMPVTLIWGRHDGLLPVAYAEALQKKIPGSTLSIIEDAAHIPHRQQPRKFVQCLKMAC